MDFKFQDDFNVYTYSVKNEVIVGGVSFEMFKTAQEISKIRGQGGGFHQSTLGHPV